MNDQRALEPDHSRFESSKQRARTNVLRRQLGRITIDGATDEIALTLSPAWPLHVDGLDTDRVGYLALTAANHAAHRTRPPTDLIRTVATASSVTAPLHPDRSLHPNP